LFVAKLASFSGAREFRRGAMKVMNLMENNDEIHKY